MITDISAIEIKPHVFDVVKEAVTRGYCKTGTNVDNLSNELRWSILIREYYNTYDKKNALTMITIHDLEEFSKNLWKGMFVEALIQGNLTSVQATDCMKYMMSTLKITSSGSPQVTNRREVITQLPIRLSCLSANNENRNDENGILLVYFQMGKLTFKQDLLNQCVVHMLAEPIFNSLRTQQRLCYRVHIKELNL